MDGNDRKPIEAYFERYPEVPMEVIVKEDILRLGLRFTEAALEAARGCRPKSYYLFSFDRVTHDQMEREESSKVPDDIDFLAGPYNFKQTNVRVEIAQDTPYLIDAQDGQISLYEDERPLARVLYPPKPDYYNMTLEDGTSYGQVIPLLFGRMAFVTIYRFCQFWGAKEECKFCDMNVNLRDLMKKKKVRRDSDHVIYDAVKDPNQVATVLEGMYRNMFVDEKESLWNRMIGIILTAGTIKTTLKGLKPTDFYLQYVRAIREKIGNRIPIILIVEPGEETDIKRLYEAGVSSYNPNIEVWDKRMFQILCPGKEKYIGKAVDIFGQGNVSPNFVMGVEMARPWGFKDVDAAVNSTTEGFDYLMSKGVVPHPDSWCIEPRSALGGHPPIPLDYYIKMDKAWYELWTKYDLPPNVGWGPIGNGRGCYGNSGYVDMRAGRLTKADS
jgi:hypothetical protein